MTANLSREQVALEFPDLKKHGAKFEKALDVVLAGGVKVARFLPSHRTVTTVVGRMGDEFIDPDQPYCSCSSFFFQAQAGKEPTCYHLLGYTIAGKVDMLDVIQFSDEEYGAYLAAAIHDIFESFGKSGG